MSADWKRQLAMIIRQRGVTTADGAKRCSYETLAKRREVLFRGFSELRQLGYKLEKVTNFREKHMEALAKYWEQHGQSPATIQNKISVFRTFAVWIGKPGMIKDSTHYVQHPASVQRSYIAKEEKSWEANGVDFRQKIAEVREKDPRVAVQLELQRAFGLRVNEAIQLRPHLADKGSYLDVNRGTKGGRDRVVKIETAYQREVLERAKALARYPDGHTGDGRELKQWRNHYYSVVRRCGITRKDGITSHGLRHERLNEVYREATGEASPVQGGRLRETNQARHLHGCIEVAEVAGHSRAEVARWYIG